MTLGHQQNTGVSGLISMGGHGWLSGMFGLALDHLDEVSLVAADGEMVTCSERENPDLFWAVRGGGGNFGVFVEFKLRLNELPNKGEFAYRELTHCFKKELKPSTMGHI